MVTIKMVGMAIAVASKTNGQINRFNSKTQTGRGNTSRALSEFSIISMAYHGMFS